MYVEFRAQQTFLFVMPMSITKKQELRYCRLLQVLQLSTNKTFTFKIFNNFLIYWYLRLYEAMHLTSIQRPTDYSSGSHLFIIYGVLVTIFNGNTCALRL